MGRRLLLLALAILGLPQTTEPAIAQNSLAIVSDVVNLVAGASVNITDNPYGSRTLRTFCYQGKKPSIFNGLETMAFRLSIDGDDYAQFGGKTPSEVLENYKMHESLFSWTLLSQKRQSIQISPSEPQCLGIASRQPYSLTLYHERVDMWRLVQLSAGLLLFWVSRHLAKNSVFYYLAGVFMGVCAILLVIIYFVARLIPGRPMMYSAMLGGWALGLYVIKHLCDNLRAIIINNREVVVWYLIITGLISFLVCYRFGPPRDVRSHNIIMWLLQALAGALVYFCSWQTNGAIALIVLNFVVYYCPPSLVAYLKREYRRRFPTKRRLLTQEEYYQQTAETTANSLNELRNYLNSPGCSQWDIITRLHNPMRFAQFANGAPHLGEEEIEDYSRSIEESLEAAQEEYPDEITQFSLHYRPSFYRRWFENVRGLPVAPGSYEPQFEDGADYDEDYI